MPLMTLCGMTSAPCFVFCVRRLLSAMPYKQGGGRAACCLCRETRGAFLGAVKRRGRMPHY